MKKLFLMFIIILSFMLIDVSALTGISYGDYVTDESGILSSDSIQYISEYSSKLFHETGVYSHVVVVSDMGDYSIEDYTDYLYDSLHVTGDGILILISYNDRMIRVKVEGEIANSINNKVIDKYIDSYFMPFLKNNEWDDGIRNGYFSFYKLVCDTYDVDSIDIVVYDDLDFITKYKLFIFLIVMWINTIISYVMCKYFMGVYRREQKLNVFDSIFFGIVLFINIMLLVLIYFIDFMAAIVIFLMELVAIYSNISSYRLIDINKGKVKKKKDKKNRVVCYNKKQGGKHEKKRSR